MTLIFDDKSDPYFDREQIFQRMGDAELPDGVEPSMSPLFSPSGLIYRYVLDSPDRTPEELKVIQDWVLYRRYKSIPGIADDSGIGGTTRQYQVVLDPNALNTYHVDVGDVVAALSNNNQNAGGGFYQQGGQFYYVRGLGRLSGLDDIGDTVVATHGGVPIHVRNLGKVTIGHAPRLGRVRLHEERRRGRGRAVPAHRRRRPDRAQAGRADDRATSTSTCCRPTSRSTRSTTAPTSST